MAHANTDSVPTPDRGVPWSGGGGKEFAILTKQDGHMTPDYDDMTGEVDRNTAFNGSNPREFNDNDGDTSYEMEGI